MHARKEHGIAFAVQTHSTLCLGSQLSNLLLSELGLWLHLLHRALMLWLQLLHWVLVLLGYLGQLCSELLYRALVCCFQLHLELLHRPLMLNLLGYLCRVRQHSASWHLHLVACHNRGWAHWGNQSIAAFSNGTTRLCLLAFDCSSIRCRLSAISHNTRGDWSSFIGAAAALCLMTAAALAFCFGCGCCSFSFQRFSFNIFGCCTASASASSNTSNSTFVLSASATAAAEATFPQFFSRRRLSGPVAMSSAVVLWSSLIKWFAPANEQFQSTVSSNSACTCFDSFE